MTYELAFREEALKEWKELATPVHEQFKKKLRERCQNPLAPSARLSGSANRYKIKLRQAGFRLVYEIRDESVTVLVVSIGKRERNAVYKQAIKRV